MLRNQRLTGVLSLLALVLSACVILHPGGATGAPLSSWTFLIYLDADCDLEDDMMEDLLEMARVGSSAQVQILVLADRSEKDDDDADDGYSGKAILNVPNWHGAKLLHVENGRFTELQDWGDTNMGDPDVLVRFIRAGIQRYPARRYALLLNNHGSAWRGVCSDEGSDDEELDLEDLQTALVETAPVLAGRLELIGFDACLMGNLEVAARLAPFARYLVASEELEPGSGWEYTGLFRGVQSNPNADGLAVGRTIVDSYRDSFAKSNDEDMRRKTAGVTLAVIDLRQVTPLAKALLALARRKAQLLARDTRKIWIPLARARKQSEDYGDKGDSDDADALHDLVHLVELIKTRIPDAATQQACNAVLRAAPQAIRYEFHGQARPHAHGLSVFFPLFGEQFDEDTQAEYAERALGGRSAWFEFLKTFVALTDADDNAPQLQEVVASRSQLRTAQKETVVLSTRVRAADVEAIDEAYFVLARPRRNKQIILGQLPARVDARGSLQAEWDGSWLTIGPASGNGIICPITDVEPVPEGAYPFRMEVPMQVHRKNKEKWRDVMLYFLVNLAARPVKGELVYAMLETDNGTREWKLRPGDVLRPRYLQIDAKGRETWYIPDRDDQSFTLGNPVQIQVGSTVLKPGKYQVGFTVSDLAGHSDEQDVEIVVK